MGKMEDILRVVRNAVEQTYLTIKCPHCEKAVRVEKQAIFKENTLTLRISLTPGHRLQASTLGGMLTDMDKLLKAGAKQLGVKLEVLVGPIEMTDSSISVKFISTAVKE